MARSLARLSGVALRPGVSRNDRYYSPAAIAAAVHRAKDRIAEGNPITMLTFHGAGDDSERIIGKLTSIDVAPDGSASYEAELADTPRARTILSLVDTNGETAPFLSGVSIRGAWLGQVRKTTIDGRVCDTADDLAIEGLDLTRTPGVPGARIESVTLTDDCQSVESAVDRHLITESAEEATVTIVETAPATVYADLGYRADGQKRWPLGSVAQARAAWLKLGETAESGQYTGPQLKRVRERVKKALRGFGVQVTREGWLVETNPAGDVAEYYGDDSDLRASSFCVNVTNGPLSVSVSSYSVDPQDLGVVARAAMDGACKAIAGMDPDADGDIDVPGETDETTTEADETAVGEAAPETTAPEPDAANNTEEEAAVSEPTTNQAAEPTEATASIQAPAVAGITLTDDQFAALLGRFAPAQAAAESAPAPVVAAVAEAAPVAVAETEDQRIARLVSEQVAAMKTSLVQEMVEQAGPPARKGLVESTAVGAENGASGSGLPEGWPQKPLHEYSDEERRQFMAPYTAEAVLRGRL